MGNEPLEEIKSDEDSIDYEDKMMRNLSVDLGFKMEFSKG